MPNEILHEQFLNALSSGDMESAETAYDAALIAGENIDVLSDRSSTFTTDNRILKIETEPIYFNDGSDDVSVNIYKVMLSKKGNLNNNSFFKIGDVDCDASEKGFTSNSEIKLISGDIIKKNNGFGAVNIYSGGSLVDSFPVTSSKINSSQMNNNAKIPSLNHISARWEGGQIKDSVINIYFRKVK